MPGPLPAFKPIGATLKIPSGMKPPGPVKPVEPTSTPLFKGLLPLPKLPELAGSMVKSLGLGSAATAFATDQKPPLSMFTHHLGGAQPYVDKALGMTQNAVRSPSQFGQLASTIGKPVTEAMLQMPGGLLGLLGLHGVLAGGQALGDLQTVLQPAINRYSMKG